MLPFTTWSLIVCYLCNRNATTHVRRQVCRPQHLSLHNSYPFLLQGPTDSTSVRYSLFLSQKVGVTTFCIVIAALTLMYNHLVLSRRAGMNYAG